MVLNRVREVTYETHLSHWVHPLAASVLHNPPQMHATARSGWCTNLRLSYVEAASAM